MAEKLLKCPICDGIKSGDFLSIKDHFLSQEIFHIKQCASCGFRFINPRPDADEIGNYYKSEDYISHDASNKGLIGRIYKIARNFSIRYKYKLVRRYCPGGTILDIGCGTGEFLAYCKKMGYQCVGIEPSEKARTFAKNQNGISVFDQITNKELKPVKFDCITMWHVLEHVHDLNETLQKIDTLLTPEGVLIIAVPNSNSYDARKYKTFWAAYDVPRHLYHFTADTITRLLSNHHFIVRKILPQKLDAYYVAMLSEKYQNGKNNYLKSFLNGFRSNFHANSANLGYSSQIFIIHKEMP